MPPTLAELTADLQGWIPNCSDAAAKAFLNQSYLEYTADLPIYRGQHEFTTSVGVAEYNLAPGASHGHPTLAIRRILHTVYDPSTLRQVITEYTSWEKFLRDYPDYQSASSGTPYMLVWMAPELIRLFPPPDAAKTVRMQVYWNGTAMSLPTDEAPNWPTAHKDVLVFDAAMKAAPHFERVELVAPLKALKEAAEARLLKWLYEHVPDRHEFDSFDYRQDVLGSW